MELDEMKTLWEEINRQQKRDNAISLAIYADQKTTSARRSLRPLFWGQALQILFGLCFLILAAALWSVRPHALSVIIAGLVIHAYGIGCIVTAGLVMGTIANIDYSRSVLEIQDKLARVRRAYILGGLIGGMSWWFLWVPLLMVLAGLAHVNLYAHAPSVIWYGLGVGALGLAAMLWLYLRSRKPQHERLRRFVDNSMIAVSLRRAQAQINEVRLFAQEAA